MTAYTISQKVETFNSKRIKTPRRVTNLTADTITGNVVAEEIFNYFKDGKLQDKVNFVNNEPEGVERQNYKHKGDFDKLYLLRTFKTGSQNGVEVYFHKH